MNTDKLKAWIEENKGDYHTESDVCIADDLLAFLSEQGNPIKVTKVVMTDLDGLVYHEEGVNAIDVTPQPNEE